MTHLEQNRMPPTFSRVIFWACFRTPD